VKTAIWVCDTCGAATFHDRGFDVDSESEGARPSQLNSTTDEVLYGYRCGLVRDPGGACEGTVEYYAYSDFERYK
jgi:hypothetical protein